MSPDVSSSLSTHFPCQWNWCDKVFITKTQLLAHLDDLHFKNWRPIKRAELEARKRQELEPDISVNLTFLSIEPKPTPGKSESENGGGQTESPDDAEPGQSNNDSNAPVPMDSPVRNLVSLPPTTPEVNPASSPVSTKDTTPPRDTHSLHSKPLMGKRFKFGSLTSDMTPSPSPLPPSPSPSALIWGITAQTAPRSSSWSLAPPIAMPGSPSPKKSPKKRPSPSDAGNEDENSVQRPAIKKRTGNTPTPYSPISTRLRSSSPSIAVGGSPPSELIKQKLRSRSVTPSSSRNIPSPLYLTPKRRSKNELASAVVAQGVSAADRESSLKEPRMDTFATIPEADDENVDELDDESLSYAPLGPSFRKAVVDESLDSSSSIGAVDENFEGIVDTSMNFATQAPMTGTYNSQNSV
ncbi:hypothetical protein FRC02_002623 [Tulasnella sp. 418]|nr:hypothetical protein FRC02_002623 [Tulasnella sp. 418]